MDALDHTGELGGSLGGIASFGRDRDGELYLVTFAGRVLKIVSPEAPRPLPRRSCHGVAGDGLAAVDAAGSRRRSYRLSARSRLERGRGQPRDVLDGGTTPSIGVADVPDGTYFVRVRSAATTTWSEPPSNEVRWSSSACPLPAGARRPGTRGGQRQHGDARLDGRGRRGRAIVVEAGIVAGAGQSRVDRSTGGAISLTTGAPAGRVLRAGPGAQRMWPGSAVE